MIITRKKRSMFYEPPKSKHLSGIVSIESTKKAKKAAKELKHEFKSARSRETKTHIKRAAVLAANRAKAAAKKRDLSRKEKKELREIAETYSEAAASMDY